MRTYAYIGCGGFLGAVLRHLIGQLAAQRGGHVFPVHTLLINISGAFLLAFLLTAILETRKIEENVRLGVTTGFLGAYTTFSTLCKESVTLLSVGHYLPALSYMAASAVFGLAAAYLGAALAKKAGAWQAGKRGSPDNDLLAEVHETHEEENGEI